MSFIGVIFRRSSFFPKKRLKYGETLSSFHNPADSQTEAPSLRSPHHHLFPTLFSMFLPMLTRFKLHKTIKASPLVLWQASKPGLQELRPQDEGCSCVVLFLSYSTQQTSFMNGISMKLRPSSRNTMRVRSSRIHLMTSKSKWSVRPTQLNHSFLNQVDKIFYSLFSPKLRVIMQQLTVIFQKEI